MDEATVATMAPLRGVLLVAVLTFTAVARLAGMMFPPERMSRVDVFRESWSNSQSRRYSGFHLMTHLVHMGGQLW